MEFISGQKLTAQNLNNLVSLADGQNIPTDGQFIKSNGVNMWTAPQAKPEVVKNHKIFDVQVRYHDVNDTGQEKGNNYKPEYKPFWYVYLGTDSVRSGQNYDEWDIKIEAGSGVALVQPIYVYSQPMPVIGETLDNFEYNNAITQMRHCEIDETTGEVKNYKKFYAGKMLSNQPQVVNSDLNGWFCTGLPAYVIPGTDGNVKIMPNELYATFIRTSNDIQGIQGNVFYSVLVFSNSPIVGLGSLKKNGQYRTILPDGTTIQYYEIMGGHSQKIGSFKITASLGQGNYDVESTSMVPRDELSKEDHGWSIVKPTIMDTDDVKAAKQLVNYEFINTTFVHPMGWTTYFDGNIGDNDIASLNIYFSDLNAEDLPDSPVNAYYVDFSYTDDPETGEQNELLEIKKLTDLRGSMSYMRAALDTLVKLAQIKIFEKNNKENPVTYHKLIAVFLLNTNGKISPGDGEPIPWTIEYVSYVDTMPNFSTDLRYDFNLTSTNNKKISPKQLSLERTKIQFDIDGTTKETFVDQLYRFNNSSYKINSAEGLSAEALIRYHATIDGKETNTLAYVDLSAISADIKCDTDSTPAQKSIEKNGEYIQLHNFDQPSITTKKTTLNALSATYDLLDSNDSVLVRSGTELKYKKLQIETKLPGGSGTTTGYTGTKTQATNLKWNTNGQYKVELWGCDFKYENGLLKSVGNEKMIATLDTAAYSGT